MADRTQLYTRQPNGKVSYFSAGPGQFYAGDVSAEALDQLANDGFHEVDPEIFARQRRGYEQDLPGTPAPSPYIPTGNAAAHPVSTLPSGASRVANRSIDGTTPYFHATDGYMEEGRLPEGEDPQQLAEQGYVFADAPAFTEARTRLDPMRPPQDHSTPDAPDTTAEDAAVDALAQEMDRPYPKGEDSPADVDALASAFDAAMAPRAQPRPAPGGPRHPFYDVRNVPASVAMASPLGGAQLPSPRGGVARAVDARDENGTPDSVETLADVQGRADRQRGLAAFERGGARMGAALAGIRPDSGAADDLEKGADRQVAEYLQRKQGAETEKQQVEQDALKSPDSPQSKRFQEVVSRTLPGIYTSEQIAHMTAADKDQIFDAGKMRATLDARAKEQADSRAAQEAERTSRATEAGNQRAFEAVQNNLNRAAQREIAGMRLDAVGDKTDKMDAARGLKLEGDLRKEFEGHQSVKDYRAAQLSFDKVKAAAATPGPAGALALVFAVMKTLDPTSAVKESEAATVENARGVPESIRAKWNSILSGDRLPDTQRQDLVKMAEGQLGAYKTSYDAMAERYRTLAPQGSGDHVVMPNATSAAPPSAPGAPRRRRDAQGKVWEEQPDGSARMVL